MLNFTVITLFPPMFSSPLGHSILKKAQEKGLISVRLVDPRDYTTDKVGIGVRHCNLNKLYA